MNRYDNNYGQYFLLLSILDIILSLLIHEHKIFIILLILSVLLQLILLMSYCYKNNRITPIIELNNMSENRTILLYCSNIDLYSYNSQYKYKSSLNYIKILKYT